MDWKLAAVPVDRVRLGCVRLPLVKSYMTVGEVAAANSFSRLRRLFINLRAKNGRYAILRYPWSCMQLSGYGGQSLTQKARATHCATV